MSRNLKLTLSYDGYEYHGWQIQPGLATIQGTLAAVIESVTGESVLPQGSGRTDAGVHALAQVAGFPTESPIPVENFKVVLNDRLPPSIRVLSVEEASPDFHARHSARGKSYRYRIFRAQVCPPFLFRYVTHYPYPLDEEAMAEAAAGVIGEHDFTSFAAADPDRTGRAHGDDARGSTSERNKVLVPDAEVDTEVDAEEDDAKQVFLEPAASGAETVSRRIAGPAPKHAGNVRSIWESSFERQGDEFIYRVRGNGFLHHMVRNLVGTFLLVGKGTLAPTDIPRILALRDRSAAGATAPANGLFLVAVEY